MSRFSDFLDVYVEGEQAEEYKHRKAEEADKKQKEEEARTNRRNPFIGNSGYKNPNKSGVTDEDKRAAKSINRVGNHLIQTRTMTSKSSSDIDDAVNAQNRHMRRHPDQYKESFNFI